VFSVCQSSYVESLFWSYKYFIIITLSILNLIFNLRRNNNWDISLVNINWDILYSIRSLLLMFLSFLRRKYYHEKKFPNIWSKKMKSGEKVWNGGKVMWNENHIKVGPESVWRRREWGRETRSWWSQFNGGGWISASEWAESRLSFLDLALSRYFLATQLVHSLQLLV
jgi:hypothetical protein